MLCLGLGGAMVKAQSSPFMGANRSASTTGANANAEPSKFELTGVINLGSESLVCITHVAEQRSHWLKPGQSAGGVTVVSHDPETKSTTIRHAGREMRLTLKERSFDLGDLSVYQASGPLPSAGVALPVPLTNDEKATEARMLVSDLLEIGMIQRKAYAEAKQQEVAEQRAAKEAD